MRVTVSPAKMEVEEGEETRDMLAGSVYKRELINATVAVLTIDKATCLPDIFSMCIQVHALMEDGKDMSDLQNIFHYH